PATENALGAAVHCSPGRGNGLLLPYALEFNRPVRTASLARVARLMGVDTNGMTEDEAAGAAIEAVRALRRTIGIPDRLRDLGVQESQLRDLAETTFGIKRVLRVNPRPVTTEDLEAILRAAY